VFCIAVTKLSFAVAFSAFSETDYEILNAEGAPPQSAPCWRAVSAKLQEQAVFEERYLRYIALLGKVSMPLTNSRGRHSAVPLHMTENCALRTSLIGPKTMAHIMFFSF